MPPRRLPSVLAVLALSAIVLAACGASSRAEERSSEGVIVNGTPQVIIENFNGDIDVSQASDNRVSVEVTRYALLSRQDDLKKIDFAISQDAATVRVRSTWTDTQHGASGAGADLKVKLPKIGGMAVTVGNGTITYNGPLNGSTMAFTTGNGGVNLTVPGSSQFKIKAVVGNGKINNNFKVQPSSTNEKTIDGAVGPNPATTIAISIGNGDVTLKQGQ